MQSFHPELNLELFEASGTSLHLGLVKKNGHKIEEIRVKIFEELSGLPCYKISSKSNPRPIVTKEEFYSLPEGYTFVMM